ncbi:MAG TPA: VWA domain-containing protein [Candidatus Treponema faecavium]|nr:VWA domain-containing protein [Candidatus Treponema faecavium]
MKLLKSIRFSIGTFAFLSAAAVLSAADLSITPDDIRLEAEYSGSGEGFTGMSGYHLYVRQKEGVNSVLLTETTRDPTGMLPNYAYRARDWNPVNGDELRLLNGLELRYDESKYSIIDSTPEADSEFGRAFHLYIPAEMDFGYPETRHGTVVIQEGTFVNIRVFEKPYADYTGNFADNPYIFDLILTEPETPFEAPVEEETVQLVEPYSRKAVESFDEIASSTGGRMIYSKGPESIVDDLLESVNAINPKNKADIVIALDATGSMKDDLEMLRKEWVPRLREQIQEFDEYRIGLLLYRDYGGDYMYRKIPVRYFEFTDDIEEFIKSLNSFRIVGNEGGDKPEAVYEALYASLDFYPWADDAQRKIILIGDAEPHPTPRGPLPYTKELVDMTARVKEITIDTIITPDK